MIGIAEILSYSFYVICIGSALIIIALLEPSKILIKQIFELNLPTFGSKRSLFIGLFGFFVIIIGIVGVLASDLIADSSPEITRMQRIPESPINISNDGKFVTICVDVVDLSDPYMYQAANNTIQRLLYKQPQFTYEVSIRHPEKDSYELITRQTTENKSLAVTWQVFPYDAGENQMWINVSVKDKKNVRSDQYIVVT